MKKAGMYFRLELKRMIRTVPILIVGMLIFIILIAGLAFINGTIQENSGKEFDIINVAITGSRDDKYTNLAVDTIEKMETVKNSCNFIYCSEEEADAGLKDGKYDVVFIMPEDYVKGFMHGENKTVTVRFGKGQSQITSYVMKQLAGVAEELIVKSESNIYAMQDYYREKDPDSERDNLIDINIEYFTRILGRSSALLVEEVDVTDGMSMPMYYFCDAIVLIFLFIGLQCSKMLQKNDLTLERKMRVSGIGAFRQTVARFAALLITFFVMYFLFSVAATAVMPFVEKEQLIITNGDYFSFFVSLMKASLILIPICTLIMLVYEMFEETANGVLFLFVLILGLGFMAGCFYPLSFMPEPIRIASDFTITRAMFCYVGECVSGTITTQWLLSMFIYTVVLFGAMVLIRRKKMA